MLDELGPQGHGAASTSRSSSTPSTSSWTASIVKADARRSAWPTPCRRRFATAVTWSRSEVLVGVRVASTTKRRASVRQRPLHRKSASTCSRRSCPARTAASAYPGAGAAHVLLQQHPRGPARRATGLGVDPDLRSSDLLIPDGSALPRRGLRSKPWGRRPGRAYYTQMLAMRLAKDLFKFKLNTSLGTSSPRRVQGRIILNGTDDTPEYSSQARPPRAPATSTTSRRPFEGVHPQAARASLQARPTSELRALGAGALHHQSDRPVPRPVRGRGCKS